MAVMPDDVEFDEAPLADMAVFLVWLYEKNPIRFFM